MEYYQLIQKLYPELKTTEQFLSENSVYFRLEPRPREKELTEGVEMRTADPLWMLGRQWQFGEFQGENAGSPVTVEIEYDLDAIDHYRLGDNVDFKPSRNLPLEAIVENIEFDLKANWYERVKVGQQFERILMNVGLNKEKIEKIREAVALVKPEVEAFKILDGKTQKFIRRMHKRVTDGLLVLEKLEENEEEIAGILIGDAGAKLKKWYEQLYFSTSGEKAWQNDRLQHQFSVSNSGSRDSKYFTSADAPDYQSGHLDWYSFDKIEVNTATEGWSNMTTDARRRKTFPPENPKSKTEDFTIVPAPVTFGGMPKKRLFEMEDGNIYFGNLTPGVSDLSQLMLIEFALVYSNDWFVVPLDVPLGSFCWVHQLKVKDVFGVETIIGFDEDKKAVGHLNQNEEKVFDLFKVRPTCELSTRAEADLYRKREHFLVVPPVVPHKQESQPLEELWILRDEYANMVWAKEETVQNGMGMAQRGAEVYRARIPIEEGQQAELNYEGQGLYRLATTVPPEWIPFIPNWENNVQVLKKGVMLLNEDDNDPKAIPSISYLAEEIENLRLEHIPRAGLKLQLTKQRVRWIDGQTYTWLGRKVNTGKGQGSSGLRFDYLKEKI